jgi:peptidoglycan/xylan/chitin deacetylase (PgdA/CDA1 family)
VSSASDFTWPDGARCAVSLTYDDGLHCHHAAVAPALASAGLRGTFYVPIWGTGILADPRPWHALAAAGHELGNHSVFHPCRGPRDWLDPGFDLRSYSRTRLRAELEVANGVLQLVDGRTLRSYGNTCANTTIGEGDAEEPMLPVLRELFVAARGAHRERIVAPADIDVYDVGGFMVDGRTFGEIREIVTAAMEVRGWAVIMIHGVSERTHPLWLDADVHARLVGRTRRRRYAASIWTATRR